MLSKKHSTKKVIIKKASGETELFNVNKLINSLRRAGANDEIIKTVINDITEWIYSGVTTKMIYNRAFRNMRRLEAVSAARYKLKHAMFELGPTGYPFEQLMGMVFQGLGFSCEVGVIVEGCCLNHEMDVIATKQNEQHFCECKYSVDQGRKIGAQVSLYVKSRVEDIVNKRKSLRKYQNTIFKTWIITNTRFSEDSIEYAKCIGINLLSWDYPSGEGLRELIEKQNLYPITVLDSLNKKEKGLLLSKEVVTCKQIIENPKILTEIDLAQSKINKTKKEINNLLRLKQGNK